MTWPNHHDNPTTRARRVALAYRTALETHNPRACAELDQTMRQLGQHWATPNPCIYDADDHIPAAEAAELAGIGLPALAAARRKGTIPATQTGARTYTYRVADILTYTATRNRNGK